MKNKIDLADINFKAAIAFGVAVIAFAVVYALFLK